jgi:hypothetical protein
VGFDEGVVVDDDDDDDDDEWEPIKLNTGLCDSDAEYVLRNPYSELSISRPAKKGGQFSLSTSHVIRGREDSAQARVHTSQQNIYGTNRV